MIAEEHHAHEMKQLRARNAEVESLTARVAELEKANRELAKLNAELMEWNNKLEAENAALSKDRRRLISANEHWHGRVQTLNSDLLVALAAKGDDDG